MPKTSTKTKPKVATPASTSVKSKVVAAAPQKKRPKPKVNLARAYADRLVLLGIAQVDSTLRLGELASRLAGEGINLAGLRALLATNPERFVFEDRKWVPASRSVAAGGPLNELIRLTLLAYGAPMPIADLAGEVSRARGLSREYFEERLPAILESDPMFVYAPSGFAALSRWLFIARAEIVEDALYLNDISPDDVAAAEAALGKIDFRNSDKAARETLKHAPVSAKLAGFFAWRQLNPQDPYAIQTYDTIEFFDALLRQPGFVFGADGKLHPATEAPKWLKAALKDAEKLAPAVEVEEAAPLEFGEAEVGEVVKVIMESPISVSVGKLLEKNYEMTPLDRTYPEDLANAIAALEQSNRVWYVGGDRFRKPDSAPDFIFSVPDFFHYVNYDFRDDDGEPVDVELSDDGFSSSLRKEMSHSLAQDVLDEDPQPKSKKQPEQLRLVLKSLHREIGTFPLCQIPLGWLEDTPAIQELIFRDAEGKELNVWVNHEARLLFNLIDWWFEQPIESGAVFTLSKTPEPNVLDFRWLDETDPLIFINSQRMEELRDLAARAAELSTYEILIEILSHYSKGADYLTILAETNVVRRVTRRLVASILSGYHAFFQRAGSPVWHFDPKRENQGFDKAKRKFIRNP